LIRWRNIEREYDKVMAKKKFDDTLRFLKEEELPLWDALVKASPQGSVYCYSWWLKAIDDVRVLGHFKKDRLVAGIPLYLKKKFGFTICTMPKLTQTWGVVIEPLSGKRVKAASKEMAILKKFANVLVKYKVFLQNFSPNLQNWLPFYWRGFKQTTRFTYALDDLTDLEEIWKGFRENIRTDIRKAQKQKVTVDQCRFEDAFCVFEKNWQRQKGSKPPYTKEYLLKLYSTAKHNDSGECFAARGSDKRIHAAAFLIWDSKRAYYLVGGGDPDLRNSGATSLLIWHLIQFAAQRSKVFDFEGSVIEPIERFFRAFGASQIPYNTIYKLPLYLEILQSIRGK